MTESLSRKRILWIELGGGIVLLALFILSLWLLVNGFDKRLRGEFLRDTEYMSLAIDAEKIQVLSGSRNDLELDYYHRLKEQLELTRFVFPEIRFLYLMGQNPDSSIFFYIDSETPGSPDESLPGDVYHEMTAEHLEVIRSQMSTVIGPVQDYWGNWISALVPVVNESNGKVEAIFGVDIDAGEWQTKIIKVVLFPSIVLLLTFIFLLFSFHVALHRNQYSHSRYLRKVIPVWESIFFLIFGIFITIFFSWLRFQNINSSQKETFYQIAGARSGYINSYFYHLENIYLEGIKNFFEGSQYVDLDEFTKYTSALANDENVLAWGWFPELKPDEIDSLEADMRAMGADDYELWEMDQSGNRTEVAERSVYYPIAYIYPLDGNEIAYGFDHASEPLRLHAIQVAKQTKLTTATDPVPLLQTNYGDLGILVFKYVQKEGLDQEQNGFTQAIINMQSLLKVALGQQPNNEPMLYLDLFQIKNEVSPLLLSSNSPAEYTESHLRSFMHEHPYARLDFIQPIYAFGKVYAIVAHPGPVFSQSYPNAAGWNTTILGLLVTLLSTAIVYSFTAQRSKLENEVLARTDELLQSEQKYKNLAESTSAVLWEYDIEQDRWTYVAPQVKTMTGWSPKDFTNLQFWVDHIHKDDKHWAPSYCADFNKRGENHEFEYRFTRPDGSFLWIRDVVSVEMDHDKPVKLRGYMLDITQKKEAEETHLLQSTALEASVNAIVITNKKGEILWANAAFEKLTGYGFQETIGNEPGDLLKSGFQGSTYYKIMWDTILSGDAWRGELINKRKDGSYYHEEMSITPVKDPNGEITHFIAIKQDISERKQYEFELEAMEKMNATIRFSKSKKEMIPKVLELLMDLFQAEGSALVLYDRDTNNFKLETAKGVFEGKLQQNLGEGLSVSGIVQKSGEPFITEDISKEEGIVWSSAYEIAPVIACVPLFVEGHSIGNLRIGRKKKISKPELRLLVSISNIVANAVHRELLREDTVRQLERLSTLRSIDQVVTSIVDIKVVLNYIIEQIATRLNIDAVAIHLYNPISHRLRYADGKGFITPEIEKTNVLIGNYNIGKVALNKKTMIKPSITAEDFIGGQLVQKEKFVSYFAAPVIAKGQIKGVLEIFNRTYINPDEDWINYFEILAGQTAIAIDNSQLFEGLQRSNFDLSLAYDATIEGWSRAMDLRDRETEGHTLRVTDLTIKLARMAGVKEDEIIHIRRGALLHDMGKLGIPDSILHKPGPLNDEEWELMRKHPIFAYEMLAPIDYLKKAMDIPYCHHERWDGSGYPRGLKGENIPLAARIFAVVDVYDALTSDRPYRPAWEKQDALDYIVQNRGIQFDPNAVEMFLELINSQE